MSTRTRIGRVHAAAPSATAVPSSECVVASLDGSLPHDNLIALRQGLDEVLKEGHPVLVVDISKLGRLTSSTVAALLTAKRRCQVRRIDMVVRQDRRRSHLLVDRVGLASVFGSPQHIAAQRSSGRPR
jgi:anti-anti-sigma regulatory factor